MITHHFWSDKDGVKQKQSKENLSDFHSAHHKYRMDLHETEPGPRWEAGIYQPEQR